MQEKSFQRFFKFLTTANKVIAEKQFEVAEILNGKISNLTQIEFKLPSLEQGKKAILSAFVSADGFEVKNQWNIWVFPEFKNSYDHAKVVDKLTIEDIEFMKNGGGVMLCNNFPGETLAETFRPHTSGRCLGHSGAFVNSHPIWEKFPHDNFADWQFYELMTNSKSLVSDSDMPDFKPLFELIPSFKLIKHKSLLSEYQIGNGRLIIAGFNFDTNNPASNYLKGLILQYLNSQNYVEAPEWDLDKLLSRIRQADGKAKILGKKIDAGGRPIDD